MIALALFNPFSQEEFDKWWGASRMDDSIGDMGRAGALAAWREADVRLKNMTGQGQEGGPIGQETTN